MATTNKNDKPYAATRAAATLTFLSVLAPMTGLAVDMVLAWHFGASETMDAYRIAIWVILIGAQLFSGSVLPHVIVPLFSECCAEGRETEGWRLAFSLAWMLTGLSLIFIAWVWADPAALAGLLGPGLSPGSAAEAGSLIRYFSLVFLLMAWAGVANGILYARRVFWMAPVGQMLPNLGVMGAIVAWGDRAGSDALAGGILLGYGLLLGMLLRGLIRVGAAADLNWRECWKFGPPEGLAKAVRLAVPLLAGILIVQWGTIVINRALSELPPGTLAEYGYAWKLLALTSLLPAGLATVVFPAFSDAHASDNNAEFARLATRALRMTLFLTVPLSTLLYVEREPLVAMMFGRGGMTMAAQANIGQLFGILLIGAPAGALVVALNKIAYATHDTKSPTVVMLISTLFLTFAIPPAASGWGVDGVAWVISANSLGYVLVMLGYQIFRGHGISSIARYSCLLILMCVGAAFPALAIHALFVQSLSHDFIFLLLETVLAGLAYTIAVLVLSRWLAIRETEEIARYLLWQLRQMPVIKAKTSR